MCTVCGAAWVDDARFCTACGTPTGDAIDGAPRPTAAAATAAACADGNRPVGCRGWDLPVARAWASCPRCGAAAPAGKKAVLRAPDVTTTVGAPPGGAPAHGVARVEGWYPDPFGRGATRWWDGATWTAYVSDTDVHWEPVSFPTERQPGVKGIGVAFIGFAIGVALGVATSYAMHEAGEPGGRAALLLVSAFSLWLGLGGAIAYVTFVRGSRSLVTDYGLRFRWVDVPLGVAGWIAGRVLGGLMVVPIVAVWPDLRPTRDDVYGDDPMTTAAWIVLALVVCIGAPFIEELFFRGLMQTRLVDRYGAVVGILVTSVLFGAAHLIGWVGPVTFVYATAITGAGIVLGLLRHLTGRLGAPMLAHAFFNTQALVLVWLLR